MNERIRLEKIEGCLLGVAIGDAMGMPVETLKHDEIMAVTKGDGICGFRSPIAKRDWLKNLNPGDTTDDWQLTKVVARSLLRSGARLDIDDCAAEHVLEFGRSTFGWGKTTERAIEDIKNSRRIPSKQPLPPAEPGKDCGNGVIMKVAPLVIHNVVHGYTDGRLWGDIKALGGITHPDIRASIAAYAVGAFMRVILYSGKAFNAVMGKSLLKIVIRRVQLVEKLEKITTNTVSERLKKVEANLGSDEELRNAVGCGFYALDTAAFTIGMFIRHCECFESAILGTVNSGGDTDTNASIVGALAGANLGKKAIPDDWIFFKSEFQNCLDLGFDLHLMN